MLGGSVDRRRTRIFVLRDARRWVYRVLGGSCKTASAMNKGCSVSASIDGAGPPCRHVSTPLFESDSPGAVDLRTDDKSIGSRFSGVVRARIQLIHDSKAMGLMGEIEHEDDGDIPLSQQPMPRRRHPDDEADGQVKRDRGEGRTHDGVTPNGLRKIGRSRRLDRRRRPRNRNAPSGPPR